MKKRSLICYQRLVSPRTDGLTCQLPVTLFLHNEERLPPGLRIKMHVARAMNLCVPYIAAPDRYGQYEPLELDGSLFPEIPQDTPAVKALKMRKFRLSLPPAIASQYRIAALLDIPGFDTVTAIESGAVIRELMTIYENRRRLSASEWTLLDATHKPHFLA